MTSANEKSVKEFLARGGKIVKLSPGPDYFGPKDVALKLIDSAPGSDRISEDMFSGYHEREVLLSDWEK